MKIFGIRSLLNDPISVETGSTTGLSTRVYVEQMGICYRQIPAIIVGPSVAALILAWIMAGQVAPPWLAWGWLAAVLILTVPAPMILVYLYRHLSPVMSAWTRWGRMYALTAGIAGIVWGSAGWLLFILASLAYQLVVFLFMFAAAALVISATVAYRPAFLSVMIPMLAPVALRSALEADPLHYALSGTTVVYAGTLIYFYHIIHRALLESLRLRFENVDLMRQLTARKDEAERANAAKSHFLASASHDLRQPVHALGLFVTELLERIRDPETRAIVDRLQSSVGAMRGMLNSLLDVSRLDAGVIEPIVRHFPISDILADMKLHYGPPARDKGLRFHVMPSSLVVRSDPALLGSIVHNLVANAVRYTASGGVVIGCRRRMDRVRIEVCDTGIGIPAAEQNKIFQEFYQVGNSERDREKGMGLGLAIADRIARLLDCTLTLRSNPGEGSVFTVEVPRGQQAKVVHDRMGAGLDTIDVAGAMILMIEDDPAVLEGTCGVLKGWGCQARGMKSIDEAIAFLDDSSEIPDAILADFRLRGGATGVEAIHRVRETCGARIPAMLITGDTAPERLREARASGFPLLHKPVAPVKLRALLSYVLQDGRIGN